MSTISNKPKKFISIKTLRLYQESIAFLDNYKTPVEVEHFINVDKTSLIDKEKTKLLARLGEINIEREQIINELLK